MCLSKYIQGRKKKKKKARELAAKGPGSPGRALLLSPSLPFRDLTKAQTLSLSPEFSLCVRLQSILLLLGLSVRKVTFKMTYGTVYENKTCAMFDMAEYISVILILSRGGYSFGA